MRIMRGTPSPDGPQGSFEKIDLTGAAADKEARRRIAALLAEGFEEIVETEPPALPKAKVQPRPKPAPSKARRRVLAPA